MPQSRLASPYLRILVATALCTTASHSLSSQAAQQARTARFLEQRGSASRNAGSQRAADSLLAARKQSAVIPQVTSLTAAWQPLGPSSILSPTFGNLTGRVSALAADPNDTTGNTLYIGTTGGGVWRSTNAAGSLSNATFTPLTDAQASLSIGAVAVQPLANPVLLAGTGDPNDATDSYYGLGLLRSIDSGATWTLISNSHDGVNGNHSFVGLATAGLAFSTATPTLVVAAFSTSPQSAIVSVAGAASVPGLYYSADAGVTWQMATIYDGASIVQQPQPLGTGQIGNAVSSVVWDGLRQRFFAAVRNHGYYSSADGATWTRLTAQPGTALTTANCPVGLNGAGASTCPIFRGVLAVQPVTGDLYALTVDNSENDQGLWQDLCLANAGACSNAAPTFGARVDNGAFDTAGTTEIAQGTYNLALTAAPSATNSTLLFAGTVDLYRCSLATGASSCTWRDTTNALDGCNAPAAVAPAQHALAAIARNDGVPIVYLGNDGGLWRSLDGVSETGAVCAATDRTHFDNLNAAIGAGGSLSEVVNFAQHPSDPNTLLAGLGANGSAATSTASSLSAWPQLSGGEGGYPLLDPNTPTNWMLTIGAGINLSECTLGGNCAAADFLPPATIGAPQVNYDASLLDAPLLLDPSQTTNVLVGTCRVWRGPASTGTTWSNANAISPAFNGGATPCSANSALLRSLAAGGPYTISSNTQLSGSSVLYAGLSGALDGGSTVAGHVFITNTANTSPAWRDIALSPVTNDVSDANIFNPGSFDVASLTVDIHDTTGATIYATIMGFGYPHVYRSTDFGALWVNVSANLPDAPANSLVVDPNDANTVYVSLDTGVYVTQSIAACPTMNCWSLLGTGLPDAPVIALEAGAGLPAGGGTLGVLRAATYGRGIWQTPLLTASAPAQAALTLSALSFTFPPTQVSTQSAAQTLTITSSGSAPATITSLAITNGFTENDDCSGQTLGTGAQCTVNIMFAPIAALATSGSLTIYANIPTGQATVTLDGMGTTPPSIVLTPNLLTFPVTLINQSSASQDISIANTGGTTATLQSPLITGEASDFILTANTCTGTLPANTGCTVSITFTPTAAGARSATFSLTDSAGTQTTTLNGTGEAPATDSLSPNSLVFAQQQVSTISAAQQVTLTNAGGVALTLISASVSAGDFAIVNGCGNSLSAGSTCSISVMFSPSATGARPGTLTISDEFRSQTVTLTGTGVAPPGVSLTPSSLTFAHTGVSLASPAQTVTLTNNGGLPLSFASPTVSAGFAIAASDCVSPLAASTACSYTLIFAPITAGPANGALTLVTNANPATQTVSLSGTGVDFVLAATGPTSVTIKAGTSAFYTLQLSSVPSLSDSVSLACSGAPANSTCTIAPPSGTLGVTTPLTVTITTGSPSAQLREPRAVYLALLLPLSLFLLRKRRLVRGALIPLGALCLIAMNGCVGNRIIPPSYPSGSGSGGATPTGTYSIAVTATADGVTHTVPLTLVVQ